MLNYQEGDFALLPTRRRTDYFANRPMTTTTDDVTSRRPAGQSTRQRAKTIVVYLQPREYDRGSGSRVEKP
jgi:murein tripeptide amidase MpaA